MAHQSQSIDKRKQEEEPGFRPDLSNGLWSDQWPMPWVLPKSSDNSRLDKTHVSKRGIYRCTPSRGETTYILRGQSKQRLLEVLIDSITGWWGRVINEQLPSLLQMGVQLTLLPVIQTMMPVHGISILVRWLISSLHLRLPPFLPILTENINHCLSGKIRCSRLNYTLSRCDL